MSIDAPGHIRPRWITSVGLGAIIALSASSQALAATAWTDPVGDALFRAPAYADIVAASVELDAGTFELTMTVADVIPEALQLPPPAAEELRWAFPFDLDPSTFPIGYPAPVAPESGQGAPAEGFVAVAWNGSAFSATWYDRRPLLAGGEATATSVPFEIDGDTVRVWLDGSLIGDPAGFRVGFLTVAVPVLPPNLGYNRRIDSISPFYNAWP